MAIANSVNINGESIYRYLKDRNIIMTQLSRKLGTSKGYISNCLTQTGTRSTPTFKFMCSILGVEEKDFIAKNPQPYKNSSACRPTPTVVAQDNKSDEILAQLNILTTQNERVIYLLEQMVGAWCAEKEQQMDEALRKEYE